MSELLSALTGGILGSPGANTTKSTSATDTSSGTSTSGGSTYAQNLNPAQTQVLNPVSNTLTSMLSDPTAYVAPYVNTGINSVNDNYAGVGQSLRQQFLATGGGTSGKYGTALASANQARLGQISNVDTAGEEAAAQLPLQASGLAESLLGLNFGGTTTSTGSSTSNGSSNTNSTQVGPNSTIGGLLEGLLGSGGVPSLSSGGGGGGSSTPDLDDLMFSLAAL